MLKNTKLILISVLFLLSIAAVAFYFLFSNAIDNRNSKRQAEMMALILEWGRLAPFPDSASDISVQTEGNSFTRSFRASFVAPNSDIEKWVLASPGLIESNRQELSSNRLKYIVVPGGGANQAEVIIDFGVNKVDIYVSGS